jgi:predicted small metal-binding protein
MRAVDCDVPNCAHLHAEDDDQLVQEAMRHAQEVHPEDEFPESAAREWVQKGVYDDTQHAVGTGESTSG